MGVEPLKLKDGNPEIFVKFWNPCLRLISKKSPCLTIQWQERPHFGFGYDDSSDTYKVVAVFWDHTTQKMEGRVHCMANNCWRKILACPIFPILLRSTLNGPFVNGNVNWLALYNSNRHPYKWENVTIKQLVIFSLDLRKETCMYMLLPDGFGEVPKEEPALVVLRGRMCLYYDHMGTHFVLWEMREFGVQESWTQLVNVSYVDLQYDWQLLPVCLSENGDVMLLGSKGIGLCDDDVIMYNRRDGRVECIELPNSEIWVAVEHMQSLVLPCPCPH